MTSSIDQAFCAAARDALASGNFAAVSDEALRDVFTAAVKLYAAKVASSQCRVPMVEKDTVTATEAVIAVCSLMHASDLNPFDVAMWYRRPVGEPAEAGR